MPPRPRGLRAVYAMARPRRSETEGELLIAAVGADGSARRRGQRAARAVVEYLARYEAAAPDDLVAIGLRLAAALSPSPVEALALAPECDAAALLRGGRLARFEARECRQLSDADWRAETRDLLASMERVLAERYAKALRSHEKVRRNRVFAHPPRPTSTEQQEIVR